MTTELGLLEAIPYLRAYAGQTFVVKVGGELLDAERSLAGIATDVAALHRLGIRVVLVHGGGPQLDRAAVELGVESTRVAGRRVTSPELIDAAVMVWRGRLNTLLVTSLLQQGEAAVGLSGADGRLVQAHPRPPAVVTRDDGTRVTVDYGEVGDVRAVDVTVLESLLASGTIPVISPLAIGPSAQLLNVNADTVATELAVALGAAKLILVTCAPGILANPQDASSVVPFTDLAGLAELERGGKLTGGMRPKVAAIRGALQGGVPRVHVVDGRDPHTILREVFTTDGAGTLVVADGGAVDAEFVVA